MVNVGIFNTFPKFEIKILSNNQYRVYKNLRFVKSLSLAIVFMRFTDVSFKY